MLKVTLLELVVRGIPEGLLFILLAYAFDKKIINVKRYILSSIIYSACVYLIRLLPIQNGADFILNLVVLISLTVVTIKIDIIKAIKSGIIAFLLGFICEGINVFFLQFILKKDLNMIFNDPISKVLYSSPSLLLLGVLVFAYYIRLWKRRELKND